MTVARAGSGLTRSVARVGRHSGFRFLVVGIASVAVDAGMLYVLHGRLGMPLPPATGLAFLAGLAANFALNRHWSFSPAGALSRQFLRYAALVAANLVTTVGLVQAITWLGPPYLVAKLITTAALTAVNYVAYRRWVFA